MANPPSDYYVDPSIAGNSGAGTTGDPYGDLQHALDTITRNATDGDRINVKAGTAEILTAALSLTTYGTPAFTAPLIFQGYTTAQGDGGVGAIDCQTFTALTNAGTGIHWFDMEVYDGPAAGDLITVAQYSCVARCYVHDTTGNGINVTASNSMVIGNRLEDIGDATHSMINNTGAYTKISSNYLLHGGTRNCEHGIASSGLGVNISKNIISIDAGSNGISVETYNNYVEANTILSSAGTGTGILYSGSFNTIGLFLVNNYVEGFSGGKGISCTLASNGGGVVGRNALYDNNTTQYTQDNEHILDLGDNEVLTATGIAKSGADTYANRFIYYAPVDITNMQDGGYPEA